MGSRQLPTIHDAAYPRLKSSVAEKDRLDLNRKPPPIGYHLPILGF
jgi:hypothetical protein